MRLLPDETIEVKSPAQLATMREAGLVTAAALRAAVAAIEPGISTAELDAIAEREIRAAGAIPSFLGYHGFPATICASVNDQIVHGIPSPHQVLRAGDLVSVDCGAIVDGWHGDAAVTIRVTPDAATAKSGQRALGTREDGEDPEDEVAGLLDACEGALWHGLAQAVPGHRLGDISHAIEQAARAAGPYGIIREYTGHGIGAQMHMDPPVPNFGRAGRGPVLSAGMTLAIEPMLVLGRAETLLLDDDWTVVTADGSWAAHFEHTVAVTEAGPWVLTSEDGGASGFARLLAGGRVTEASPRSLAAGNGQAALAGAIRTTGTASEGARHGI